MTNTARKALKRLVVGQSQAVAALSRLIDMHFSWFDMPDPQHRPPNALIVGPTGTGKTHAIKVAAAALQIPCLVVDSTRLVSTGSSTSLTLEDILQSLVKRARPVSGHSRPEDVAARGIIFLDEFDKLRYLKPTDDTAAVQRRLLQFIEGDSVDLAPGEYDVPRDLDTQGILFIAAGAFTNIQSVVHKRAVGRGWGDLIRPEDVHRYGFLEELAARLPIIIRFDDLDADALREILVRDEVSPLKFYREYFKRHGIQLDIAPDAQQAVAEAAAQSQLGARGLHQELFPVLNDLANQLIPADSAADAQDPHTRFELTSTIHRQLKNGSYELHPEHKTAIDKEVMERDV
ncbi:AAA family ATPase [Streptomyces lincolnensis]|uniref:AAA family ATPase n=1 Tax=Streptomyces lincolnensis TaxID=1915 RepID=UPI001E34DE7F|nr:AAA family ATPase [Streptomyces lincolnensis]MCD7441863.1 AAA family ATPase [Streptomyces lincolnensis]